MIYQSNSMSCLRNMWPNIYQVMISHSKMTKNDNYKPVLFLNLCHTTIILFEVYWKHYWDMCCYLSSDKFGTDIAFKSGILLKFNNNFFSRLLYILCQFYFWHFVSFFVTMSNLMFGILKLFRHFCISTFQCLAFWLKLFRKFRHFYLDLFSFDIYPFRIILCHDWNDRIHLKKKKSAT